jgi:hypothetical protein
MEIANPEAPLIVPDFTKISTDSSKLALPRIVACNNLVLYFRDVSMSHFPGTN